MGNEKVADSPVGKLLKLVASKNLAETKAIQAESPEALCFPTDSNKIVFNGKEYGGDINAVVSVAGKKGTVTLAKADVGLPNVDNTSDVAKPVSTATQNALNTKANAADVYKKTETYTKNEIDTKVTQAVSTVYKPMGSKATIAEVIALTNAKVGDVWNVEAEFTLSGKKYPASTNVVCVTATSTSAHVDANWDALGGTVDLTPYAKSTDVNTQLSTKVDKVTGKGLSTNDYTAAEKTKLAGIAAGAQVNTVTSVAGKTGAVTLAKTDVGLPNVDNTSDAAKPISTATQSALNNKVDKVSGKQLSTNDYTAAEKTKLAGIAAGAQVNAVVSVAGRTGAVTLAKADIGLSSVDNTSDANKPISTATQSALNNKVDKVIGKGLSTNDYTNSDKQTVGTLKPINRYTYYLGAITPEIDSDTIKAMLTPLVGNQLPDVENPIPPNVGDRLVSHMEDDGTGVLITSADHTNDNGYATVNYAFNANGLYTQISLIKDVAKGTWRCEYNKTIDLNAIQRALQIG